MGYLYLLAVAIMFSFGGTCNRMISPYFSPLFIAFFRFLFGIIFLIILKLILRQPFRKDFKEMAKLLIWWIIFGAIGKWLCYLFENIGFSFGPSYGNIIEQPAQAVFITLVSVVMFHEHMTLKKIISIIMCIGGVLIISWNGKDMSVFLHENILAAIMFVISGFCAGAHVLSQKMVADKMDIVDSNLLIFSISAMVAFIPLVPPLTNGSMVGIHPDLACFLGIVAFGFITGIGFYLNAKAIPLVPLYMVPIIQSTMVIFAILWGVLFFHEKISTYIVIGTLIFMVGLIWLQLLNADEKKRTQS